MRDSDGKYKFERKKYKNGSYRMLEHEHSAVVRQGSETTETKRHFKAHCLYELIMSPLKPRKIVVM